MQYTHDNVGTCSRATIVDIDENTHIINDVSVIGGCSGNLKGLSAMVKGAKAEDVIERLSGITCGFKPTSCPDQLAITLKEALESIE